MTRPPPDSDWIASTLAEQAIDIDAAPTMTIGRFGSQQTSDTLAQDAELSVELPKLELHRDDTPLPRSPHLQVRGPLGEGGMGIVELAHQPLLDREVAVKRLKRLDPARAHMLLREARITGSLEHPSIIPIHSIGRHEELGPLVVMKRIQGQSWSARLDGDPARLEDEKLLAVHVEILVRVCQAVEFAHSRGVIHRDLKPANVMLGEFGELYVVDWGLALSPDQAVDYRLVGSPAYMPPEMVYGDSARVDPRSDVYLLGATLHEILTGEHRHAAASVPESLRRASASEPAEYPSSVPEELGAICNRACALDPDQRFPTAEALRVALLEYLEHRRATAVLRAAAREHELLRARLQTPASASREEAEIAAAHQRVITRYQQALELWEDLSAAREGRTQALIEMLEYELEQANLHGAQRLAEELDEIGELPRQLLERLEQLVESQHSMVARLDSLEREVDMKRTEPARQQMIGAIIVAITLINVGFFIRDPTPWANSPPDRLIALNLVVLAVTLALVLPRWRELTTHLASRQYIRFTTVTLGALLVNRVCGLLLDDSSLSIMTRDLLVIATTLSVVRLPIPGMLPMGIATAVGALLMVVLPGYARLTFLIVSSAIPLMLLVLDRRIRQTQRAAGP